MAILRHLASGRSIELEPHSLVGRAPSCHLQLERPDVSLEHATLQYRSDGWYVRDLGSTNRTWLDGRPLRDGLERLRSGSRLRFGGSESEWELVDEVPPALVLPLPAGAALRVSSASLPLPSSEQPLGKVRLDAAGNIVLEQAEQRRLLRDGEEFELGGVRYRAVAPVMLATARGLWLMREGSIAIIPSGHLEHFRVSLTAGGRSCTLEVRERHSLLHELAVARLEDRRRGVAPADEGWVYRDTLGEPDNLRHKISRIRKDVRELQLFKDPGEIFEDRRDTHEIRLGISAIEIIELAAAAEPALAARRSG